ncbi:oligogalacturonate-specific porin KdgM family protein [Psychromonas sp.]|nr:oligogalacturonate-specific porin KdgM family protein [Psychromonas sp.]
MKLQNKLIFAVGAVVLSSAVSATSLDLRQEFKEKFIDGEKQMTYASRLKLGDSFVPFESVKALKYKVSMEMKFDSAESEEFYRDTYLTETELGLEMAYKIGNWSLEPGMPISFASSKMTFKPQFKAGYTFKKAGVNTALRARYEIRDEEDDAKNYRAVKITWTGKVKIPYDKNIKFGWEGNYSRKTSGYNADSDVTNGTPHFYDFGIIVGYQLGNWRPYAEVWTIDDEETGKTTTQRQAKYRVGINYKW